MTTYAPPLSLTALALTAILGCASAPPPPAPSPTVAAPEPEPMIGPRKLSGDPAVYTPEALAAGVPPQIRVRCVVETDGSLDFCHLVNPAPSIQDAVLAALRSWRFTPILLDGIPTPMASDFDVPLVPPSSDSPPLAATPPKHVPIPFGAQMTRPKALFAPSITYPRVAREHHVEGLLVAKCVLTEEGALTHCWIIKPLRYFNQIVLTALEKARYSPALLDGKPIAVLYTIPFQFKLV